MNNQRARREKLSLERTTLLEGIRFVWKSKCGQRITLTQVQSDLPVDESHKEAGQGSTDLVIGIFNSECPPLPPLPPAQEDMESESNTLPSYCLVKINDCATQTSVSGNDTVDEDVVSSRSTKGNTTKVIYGLGNADAISQESDTPISNTADATVDGDDAGFAISEPSATNCCGAMNTENSSSMSNMTENIRIKKEEQANLYADTDDEISSCALPVLRHGNTSTLTTVAVKIEEEGKYDTDTDDDVSSDVQAAWTPTQVVAVKTEFESKYDTNQRDLIKC